MITLTQLWLPILLATLVLWIASSIIWMALPWHRKDFGRLPDEESARAALRGVPPGQYHMPHMTDRAQFKDPVYQRKIQDGPVALITVMPSGMPNMGLQMVRWIACLLLVMIVAAYVASRTLAPGEDYLEVFRIVGVIVWATFGAGTIQEGIWFGRSWRMVGWLQVDALIYAGLAGGVFGALWP